jgi:hypothetical protein
MLFFRRQQRRLIDLFEVFFYGDIKRYGSLPARPKSLSTPATYGQIRF